jgi:DNA-binding transcriptional MerR regulator
MHAPVREAKDEALPGKPGKPGKKEDGFSLQELADQSGVEPRTIRSYVERGLLPGPETLGRGARYPAEALDRLRVMQLLRDANRDLTLDQIRVLLQSLSPALVADIASGRQRIAGVVDTDAAPPAGGHGEALAYLQALRGGAATSLPGARRAAVPPPPAAATDRSAHQQSLLPMASAAAAADAPAVRDASVPYGELTLLAEAARALTALAGAPMAARPVRAETWLRIPITPDIELSVRAVYGDDELAHLHRIGDALRRLLTQGAPR